jgi:phosphatidylinositol phospholipase C epsilon
MIIFDIICDRKVKIDSSIISPGLLTRNNSIDCHEYRTSSNLQKKQIFDAVAAASIVNNCSGVDTSKSQVITLATFTKFLESRQQEKLTDEEIKALIKVNTQLNTYT